MIYEITNGNLSVKVSSKGAEMVSVIKDGIEYLWQGDEAFWASHATNLFPICGRLTDGKYTYSGKTYEMMLHGFAKVSEFSLDNRSDGYLKLTLTENDETLKMYPFKFTYSVEYTLSCDTVKVKYIVNNNSAEDMFFTLGGHPGFNVPFDGNGDFNDYYIEFSEQKPAKALVMEECFMTDDTVPFPLVSGVRYNLKHDMFDNDAIFLCDTAKSVTLKSDKTEHSVTVTFPDMKYIGLWHKPKTQAPYICLEPWLGIPSYHNKIDELSTKRDMIKLSPKKSFSAGYEITVK